MGENAERNEAPTSLGEWFDTRPNALNAIRLALAVTVIVWHAHLLPNRSELPHAVGQLLEQFPVDAFFAISGFLITRSWFRNPNPSKYVKARFTRLFPGLWVCLAVTAFVVVPLAVEIGGRSVPSLRSQLEYVLGNATTFDWVDHRSIEDTTVGMFRSPWNVSLWSLRWEILAYAAVVVLGMLRLLRPRVVVALTATCWALAVSLVLLRIPDDFVFGVFALPRLLMMFFIGSLFWMWGRHIPLRRSLVLGSFALIVTASFTPDYRLLAAPAVAYLCLSLGLYLGRFPRLILRNDLSYGMYIYGAPVQQALLIIGFTGTWLTFTLTTLALVVPLAAMSWFLVESPAMGLLRHQNVRSRAIRGAVREHAG